MENYNTRRVLTQVAKEDSGDMPDTPDGAAFMNGFNYNVCFVVPAWDMMIVRMGTDGNPELGKRFVNNEYFKLLSKAI